MKIKYSGLVFMVVVSLFLATTAFAGTGIPAGGCAPAFELHQMDHTGEHHHPHIGVEKDLNGDGYICVKHLPNNLHLIVDNPIVLPSR